MPATKEREEPRRATRSGRTGVELATAVCRELARLGWSLGVAESCTGGRVAYLITEVPGASACFGLGVVSYANGAKRDVLGVPEDVLRRHGAVSRKTVEYMARGIAHRASAEVGIAVSGIAGPGGGTPGKPVGTVFFGMATPDGLQWQRQVFEGDRSAVRHQAARAALDMVRRYCGEKAESTGGGQAA